LIFVNLTQFSIAYFCSASNQYSEVGENVERMALAKLGTGYRLRKAGALCFLEERICRYFLIFNQ